MFGYERRRLELVLRLSLVFDVDELDVEDEVCVGRDNASGTTRA
jgi:hypothetical protein